MPIPDAAPAVLSYAAAILRYRRAAAGDLLPSLFKCCAAARTGAGEHLHADAVKRGFASSPITSNSILSFYLRTSQLSAAFAVFGSHCSRDSVTWNALLHGLLAAGERAAAHRLVPRARFDGFLPNLGTLVLLIQSCGEAPSSELGSYVHALCVRSGFLSHAPVANALITMYGKLGMETDARKVFDDMWVPDIVSWSAVITALMHGGDALAALQVFKRMFADGVAAEMDGFVVASVLSACSSAGDAGCGKTVHGMVVKRGFGDDVVVANTLVDMYARSEDGSSAAMVFSSLEERNLVSWNSVLSGLVHCGRCSEAVEVLEAMKSDGVKGDVVTLVVLLQLCKKLEHDLWCREIHAVAAKKLWLSNVSLSNALLDAYAKCGNIASAAAFFDSMDERNVIAWSTMVAGFADCGEPYDAVACFLAMREASERPNAVTMLSVISACSATTEIRLSRCAHCVAVRSGFAGEVEVSTALVDMYAKCGDVEMSRRVFDGMRERTVLTWNAMIGALGINGRASDAVTLFHRMESSGVAPNGVTMLAVLAACTHGRLVEQGLACFDRMSKVHAIVPEQAHWSCLVDMLARAGDLEGAASVISNRLAAPTPAAWGAMVSACRWHGKRELGQGAASRVMELEPLSSAGYLMSASMHAAEGAAGEAARVRAAMREKGVRVAGGHSAVHVEGTRHRFLSCDVAHPMAAHIYSTLHLLHHQMERTLRPA